MARFPDQIRGVYDDALLKLKNASDLIRDTMQAQSKFDPVPYPAPLPSQNAEISESVILVPHPANPDFTGRVSLLQELEESLRPPKDGLHVQRRTLLHGMKGIGKTQIALHFARAAFAAKIFSHVFWVPCETERLIQQTFSEIATELGLTREGLSTDVSANVQAVHKWLRQTGRLTHGSKDDPRFVSAPMM